MSKEFNFKLNPVLKLKRIKRRTSKRKTGANSIGDK